MIIKFKTPEEKSKKIAEAIKTLDKLPKLTTTSTSTGFYNTPATWTIQTSPYSAGIYTGNGLNNGAINTNTVIGGSSITTTGTAITINTNGNVGLGVGTSTNKISGSGLNNALGGITTGIANTGLGAIGTNTTIGTTTNNIYGIYGVITKHNILGTEVDVSFWYNGEIIVSLINTLGVEFWDEYTIQSDIVISNPFVYAAIEEVMKLHRRDEKLNNILGE